MRYLETDSGLAVPLTASDEAAVSRALREHDRDLRLIPQESDHYGRIVYKVFRVVGGDRPVQHVYTWRTREGEALPLSMRLVDKVKELDFNSRAPKEDEDVLNARLREQHARDMQAAEQDLIDDWKKREGRLPVFHRSQALAVARRKARRKGQSFG